MLVYFILLTFHFEIIVGSQEVAKVVERRPVYPSPSFLLWLHIKVQYQKQEFDISTMSVRSSVFYQVYRFFQPPLQSR